MKSHIVEHVFETIDYFISKHFTNHSLTIQNSTYIFVGVLIGWTIAAFLYK